MIFDDFVIKGKMKRKAENTCEERKFNFHLYIGYRFRKRKYRDFLDFLVFLFSFFSEKRGEAVSPCRRSRFVFSMDFVFSFFSYRKDTIRLLWIFKRFSLLNFIYFLYYFIKF